MFVIKQTPKSSKPNMSDEAKEFATGGEIDHENFPKGSGAPT